MNDTVHPPIPLIPRPVLFGNPERIGPQLSPDGKWLAYVAPDEGVLNIWLRSLNRADDRPLTGDRGQGIHHFFFAHDRRHVLYLQDADGDENFRLFAVPLDGGPARALTPAPGVRAMPLKHDHRHPEELLVVLNERNRQLFDVHRIAIATGERRLVEENPGDVTDWVAGPELDVLAAHAPLPTGGSEVRVREKAGAPWRPIARFGPEDLGSGPLELTPDGKGLYAIDSRGTDTSRLVLIDMNSGAVRTLAEDPQYDFSGLAKHPTTRRPEAAGFIRDRLEWRILDPAVEADYHALAALESGDFEVVSRDLENRTWIVAYSRPDAPVAYHAYDRSSRRGSFLFHSRRDLLQYTLAPVEPMHVRSRDGLLLHCYLTLPPGLEPRHLPLVLYVHGGPWHRDTWDYDPVVQWLANRGYACLQVNFRASTGFGKGFKNAGDREWGGKMHDDLLDALAVVVERGIADPKRVGIFGGSYGGYAALVGATFTPDIFRCAASLVGPSNLITFLQTIPPYWEPVRAEWNLRIGHPERDAQFLKSRSPLFFVDRVQCPMFIAQGANDPRVNQKESEQMVAALQAAGIPVSYLLFADEGHGLNRPQNRLRLFAELEEFFAAHLGGRKEG